MTTSDPIIDEKSLAVWQQLLQVHSKVLCNLAHEMQGEQNISLTWYHVLSHLDHDPRGGLRLQDLARAIDLSQSGLTRLLDRMAEAGLVERKPCSSDRRGSYAIITDGGREVLHQARPIHQHGLEQHFAQYLNASDLEQLDQLLSKIVNAD